MNQCEYIFRSLRRSQAHNLASPTYTEGPTRTHIPAMGYITRTLLGSSDKKIVHDPGAKGPSGEGEAAITMLCLTYFATVGILIYGAHIVLTNFGSTITLPPRKLERDDAFQYIGFIRVAARASVTYMVPRYLIPWRTSLLLVERTPPSSPPCFFERCTRAIYIPFWFPIYTHSTATLLKSTSPDPLPLSFLLIE